MVEVLARWAGGPEWGPQMVGVCLQLSVRASASWPCELQSQWETSFEQRLGVIEKETQSDSDHYMLTDRWAHLYMHTSHIHRHTDVQRVFFLNFKHNLLFWKNLWRSVWYDFLILDTWLSQDDYFPVACFCVVLRQLSLCREICLSSECWTQTREPLGPVQL